MTVGIVDVATDHPTPTDCVVESFGGFTLGSLQLALPMSALREVMPCTELADLPCEAPCVIGGIALRGVLVPVVDLRIAVGRPVPVAAAAHPNVVLMVHGGRILGLLADGVTGIFELPRAADVAVCATDEAPTPSIFLRGAMRADTQQLVSLLSPAAVARLPQVPMVDDPEPARQLARVDSAAQAPPDVSVPMMLVRCGRVALAVEAMLVHATLAAPAVETSALAGGHCRGVIAYGGAHIAAIDLQSLCGWGCIDRAAGTQAFVVSLAAGQVAFLISSVIDVVRTVPDDVKPVPAFALARPRLFSGSLPVSTLPPDMVERTGVSTPQYLVVSTHGLTTCDEVVAPSAMNTMAGIALSQAKGLGSMADAGRTPSVRRSMITYLLGSERASLVEQVTEILAYEPDGDHAEPGGTLLGFMVNRGRTIPMLCLDRAVGGAGEPPTSSANVLLVASDGELIGFVVPVLGTIEQAEWEPALADFKRAGTTPTSPRNSQPLALLGTGEGERMLPVIDLHRLARQLRREAAVA